MRRRNVLIAASIAGVALLLGGVVLAQTDGGVVEPSTLLLSTAAGLSIVIAVFMNLIRGLFPEPESFNRWAPLTAAILGVVGAFAFLLSTGNVTLDGAINAVLIGVFAGGYSQNVNTILTRTVTPESELPE